MNDSAQDKFKEPRRAFLLKLLWLGGGLITLIISIPVIGALLEPLLRKTPETWRSIGKVTDFKIGETVLVKFLNASPLPWSGKSAETASWLRRISDNKFIAFAVNCTHLGCPVRWLPDAEIFLCPCHGGVYNKDGSYSAGPPPYDLYQYNVRIVNDKVEIQTGPTPITTF